MVSINKRMTRDMNEMKENDSYWFHDMEIK